MTEKHKTMLMQLEGIKGSVKDEKTLSSLSTLIESIRYMDPVSSSSEKEDELSNAIKEVERIAASGGKPEKAIEKAKDAAEVLRKERKSRKN